MLFHLEELDAHMEDHVKYLRKYYKQHVFVASGRKVPSPKIPTQKPWLNIVVKACSHNIVILVVH